MIDVTHSLTEAQKRSDYYLIMEADSGIEIISLCPVKLIKCSQKMINLLEYQMNIIFSNVKIFYLPRINVEPFHSDAIDVSPPNDIWVNPSYSSNRDEIVGILTNDPKTIEKYKEVYPLYVRERIIPKIVEFGEGYFFMYDSVELADIEKYVLNFDVELNQEQLLDIQKQINKKLKSLDKHTN